MGEMIFEKPAEYYREKGCFWTAKEIFQQPASWRRMADSLVSRREEITRFLEAVMAVKNLRIITAGAGSSAFIGESLRYMLAGEENLWTENIHTTDIVTSPDEILRDVPTLLVSCARSGESPESAATVKFAEKRIKELWQIILVCDKNSTLAKKGYGQNKTLVLDMPPETCDRGFAMTGSVSSMALAAWCVFHYKELPVYAGYVKRLADSVEQQMQRLCRSAERIAEERYRRIIWIGSGALKGLAREACIKSMELTDGYVQAGYDAATGFRHGPKTVVNDETLTVHFISAQPYTRQYDLDLLKEMAAEKGKNVIAVFREDASEDCLGQSDYEVTCHIPETRKEGTDMGMYLHALVFAQLLSMHKSVEQHFHTDSPCERGEVNRIVKGVMIYEKENG